MYNIYISVIPDDMLNEHQRNNLNLARQIARSYGVYHVSAAKISTDNHRNIVGVYSVRSESIYISPVQLMRARDTVDTIIHELAHHVSHAYDWTEEYKRSLITVADNIIIKCEAGEYDRALTNVVW